MLQVVQIRSAEQLAKALDIRRAVFVAEQGVSEALEIDSRDGAAEHLLALLDDRPVGTLRLRFLEDGRIAKIERVAVLAECRGRRIGHALMRSAIERSIALDAQEARLHAQTHVTAFYESLGFVAFGEEFEEDGIPHVAMRLEMRRTDPQRPEA